MVTLILQDTYIALQDEIKSLDKLRTEIALKIQEAASHGDLKENYEYKAAKEEMEFVVNKKQLLQSYAPFRFIEFNEINTKEAEFGNKVTILEEGKNKPEDYYLLGPIEFELDLYPMIATYHSPFGQSIVGKKVDEYFMLNIKSEDIRFTITAIKKITLNEKIIKK